MLPGALQAQHEPSELDRACEVAGRTLNDTRVRIAWRELMTTRSGVRVEYCVQRGRADALLRFQRNAEIVNFGLVSRNREERVSAQFTLFTSAGRTITQGPVIMVLTPGVRTSCRTDVCQFFTNPGEHVTRVRVKIRRAHRP